MYRGFSTLKNFSKSDGFTLIDMAIALMVMGLLLVPAMKVYEINQVDAKRDNTLAAITAINAALDQYYFENGRYPCPADPGLGPGDATYGKALGDLTVVGSAPCAGDPIVEMPGGLMMAGAIPFKDLKIPADSTIDGWKNKFTYAVSAEQTRADQDFNAGGGTLTILEYDQPGENRCDVATTNTRSANAHLVLVSHGPEGIGAYNVNGTLINACLSGADATLESQNCDYGTGDRTFRLETCANNQRDDASYFDDLLSFKNDVPTRIWANSPLNAQDVFSDVSFVGINNENPEAELDVFGNILASPDATDSDKNGLAFTQEICDENDTNCFDTALVAGNDPDMQCNSSKTSTVMSGLGSSSALCDVTINVVNGDCAGGYMIGLQADGSPICTAP